MQACSLETSQQTEHADEENEGESTFTHESLFLCRARQSDGDERKNEEDNDGAEERHW